jgi:p-hydroxybenzoate 3-monooxygenase
LVNSNVSVVIIGAGPAGLTLALQLNKAGIDCIVLEKHTRQYIETRTRAGVIEQNSLDVFEKLGVADRMKREGLRHNGIYLSFEGVRHHIDFGKYLNDKAITIYGQQEVIKDLVHACLDRNVALEFEASVTGILDIDGATLKVFFERDGVSQAMNCNFVAGCDGFHGVSRSAAPISTCHVYEKEYPFNWLGILADVPPSSPELIYAFHKNGFALHSMRSPSISRFYLQVADNEDLSNWSDQRIWEELALRLQAENFQLKIGFIKDKSLTPVRSFMIDHMQFGNLFLAGDAAHIVPPTGGKGLNLAVADAVTLYQGLFDYFHKGIKSTLLSYSSRRLASVWRVQEFSDFMTNLFHLSSPIDSFEHRLQKARFTYITTSEAASKSIAENYVGI